MSLSDSKPLYSTITEELTIFYVEDDEDDRYIMEDLLAEVAPNTNLQMYKNGLALLHAVNNPPPAPAVVFIDLNLPGINGFEVMHRIKQSPALKHLPLIVISTADGEESIQKSKENGACYYIVKSSDAGSLKQSLYKALTTKWQQTELADQSFIVNK